MSATPPSPFFERLAAFRARRLSYSALVVLLGAFVLSLGAEGIANNRPLLLRFGGALYVPVLFDYAPQAFGIAAGAVQGYFGGAVDFLGQRESEIWSSVPVLFVVLIVIASFTATIPLLIALMALFSWPGIAQYQRAEFLNLRRRDFVEAARAIGASPWRIMAYHIFPNALTPVVTFTPFTIAGGITSIAALDYLGFGVPPPTPSWGELLRQALTHFSTAWWIATFTVGSMFLVLLLLVFINEGVREAFDPHRGRR